MVIKVCARAKINLTLDVLGKRPDGFHQVETVMQTIALHDSLEFEPREEGISLTVPGGGVPAGADNLVYRAARLMQAYAGKKCGVGIKLVKQIPVAAGLGGGSADAAATLLALNEMWGIRLPLPELFALSEKLGSDVPFFLLGGTALAAGRGERLTPLSPCPRLGLVLVKPFFSVSTASVYQAYDASLITQRPATGAMIRFIKEKNINGIARSLVNVLEAATISMYPEIAGIKEKLLAAGALGVLMSGSGPTVFGVTDSMAAAGAVADRYQSCGEQVLVTETFNHV